VPSDLTAKSSREARSSNDTAACTSAGAHLAIKLQLLCTELLLRLMPQHSTALLAVQALYVCCPSAPAAAAGRKNCTCACACTCVHAPVSLRCQCCLLHASLVVANCRTPKEDEKQGREGMTSA
jgi:hypothetical protein